MVWTTDLPDPSLPVCPEHGVPERHVVYEPLDLALHPPVPELHLAQLIGAHDRVSLTAWMMDLD